MKLANNKTIMKQVGKHGGELVKYLSKNSPTILTGCAIAGVFTAVCLAVKATKPALKHVKEAKIEHRDRIIIHDGDEREDFDLTDEEIDQIHLTPLEIVGAVWKDYAPTAIVLAGTTACIIGAHSISAKRTAAMAALYTMSESTLKDFQKKAEEVVGKGKAQQITDAVAQEEMRRTPYDPNKPVAFNQGDVLCFDRMTSQYFASSAAKIKVAVAEFNQQMTYGDRVSRNDFYYAIGAKGVQYGEDDGWCVENPLDVEYTSDLTSDGTPVLAIGFRNRPTPWFYDA